MDYKICSYCQTSFLITNDDEAFYTKISPTFAGQKFQIPTPILCPDCRQMRRLSFRNERNLYKRKCDASGKDIISIYSPDKPYKVYDQKIRWSDVRDPMTYASSFDFGKNFTANFQALMLIIPHMSLSSDNCEGCEFANFVLNSKQCYLLFGGGNNEGVLYSNYINSSMNCIDCSFSSSCEYSYGLIGSVGCSKSYFCINSNNCSECVACNDCESCSRCIRCEGLSNAQYCVDNKQVEKEVYESELLQISKTTALYKKSQQDGIYLSEGCSGKNIFSSKNCLDCYDIDHGEELAYCSFAPNTNNCYDLDYMAPFGSEFGYELCTSTGTKYSFAMYLSRLCIGCYYCYECRSCECCFGCIGLRNKSYCILNKQYTKEVYEQEVAKIIAHMIETGEWGEFFHPSLSPFGYNETVVQEYFPAEMQNSTLKMQNGTIDDLQDFGYTWSSYQAPSPIADKVVNGQDLPATITEVSDDILKTAVKCEVSGKLFRIIPQELAFYRKHNIPLPRKHPDQRHKERMELRK